MKLAEKENTSKPRRRSVSKPEFSETAIRRLSRTTDMLQAVLAEPNDDDVDDDDFSGKGERQRA